MGILEDIMTDREIDREIAEKVMGWKLGKPELIHGYMMHGMVEIEEWEGSERERVTQTKESFSPSTSISDAWLVVKKMIEEGFEFELRYSPKHNEFTVMFDPKLISVWHKNESLAICKAALKVINDRLLHTDMLV